jgi:hypothetical protein
MESELIVAVIVAVIGALAAMIAAAIAVVESRKAREASRVDKLQRDNALLYLWNRQLVDHIYRGAPPPAPTPPPGLFTD